jgi:glycosyltransferase involved in cell wall biosynthesis
MMKILVSVLAFDDGKSGLADYTVSVCKELSKRCQLDLLIHPSDAQIFPLRNDNIRFRLVPDWLKHPVLSMFWHLYWLPLVMRAREYDVILFPAGNRRLVSDFPKQAVVTFHDLAQYYVPDRYDRFRMFYVRHIIPHYLRRAPVIMAISENTKNDLIRHYDLPPRQIAVNYNGYEPDKIASRVSEAELRQACKLTRPYLFYNSRIEHPVKNHLHLIRAFELFPDEIREQYDLVFSGPDWHGSEIVHAYVKDSPARLNIRFLGEVEQQLLGALYKYAVLYVFPSLYEGFGIPLLEAMASGIPVLCSNRSALPEIGGGAVLTFDPEVHADIAVKLLSVLNNPDLRQNMITKGLARAKLFSWERHAEQILELAGRKR